MRVGSAREEDLHALVAQYIQERVSLFALRVGLLV